QAINAQLARLRENVSFYRERLPEGGLRSLDEVGSLPFTTKEDFRANYPFGLFAVPREEVARLHMSSGTTGRPVVTGYTRRALERWLAGPDSNAPRPGSLRHLWADGVGRSRCGCRMQPA